VANRQIIQEFLSSLGFVVNEPSYRTFMSRLRSSRTEATKLGGAILGIGIATDVMVTKTAAGMEKVYYQSLRTRASVSNLRAMEFAFGQIGLSAEDASAAVESVALAVRTNPGLSALMRKFGVGGGDPTAQIIALVRELKKMGAPGSIGYSVAAQFAEQFGISERTFQMLSLPGALEKLEEAGRRQREMYRNMGVDQDEAGRASAEFMNILRDLRMEFGAFSDAFLIQLMPAFRTIHATVSNLMKDLSKVDFKSLDFQFKYLKGFVDEQTKSWGLWGAAIKPVAYLLGALLNAPEKLGKIKDMSDEALGRAYAYIFGGANWREGGRREPLVPGLDPSIYGPRDMGGTEAQAREDAERARGGGGGYVPNLYGDKRRLTPAEQLEVLRNELMDPDRNLEWDSMLRGEIKRFEQSGIFGPQSAARDARGGVSIVQHNETNVNVTGGDARDTARAVGAESDRINRRYADIVRNTVGAIS
jgi:hypothetical protein